MDLSNEVPNIDFGQEAAKILQVKVGGKKDISPPSSAVRTHLPGVSRVGRYFFPTLALTFGIFAAP